MTPRERDVKINGNVDWRPAEDGLEVLIARRESPLPQILLVPSSGDLCGILLSHGFSLRFKKPIMYMAEGTWHFASTHVARCVSDVILDIGNDRRIPLSSLVEGQRAEIIAL